MVEKNVPAYQGVELVRSRKFIKVAGFELDPGRAALFCGAAAGVGKSVSVAVDTKDATAWADDVGDQKCHVSHARAYVQHSHSGDKSGGAEPFFGVRAQHSGLQH